MENYKCVKNIHNNMCKKGNKKERKVKKYVDGITFYNDVEYPNSDYDNSENVEYPDEDYDEGE